MKNASNNNLSRTELEDLTYSKVYRPLMGKGLSAIELLLISEVIGRHLNDQVMFTAQDSLAEWFNCSRATINRTIKRLAKNGYLRTELIISTEVNRQLRVSIGEKTIEFLRDKKSDSVLEIKKSPQSDVLSKDSTTIPQEEKKLSEAISDISSIPEVVVVAPAPIEKQQAAATPSRKVTLNDYTKQNTLADDIGSVLHAADVFLPLDKLKSLEYWPAKGRGLSIADAEKVFSWSGIHHPKYARDYVASGSIPSDPHKQLEHCRLYARDVHHRISKLHEDAKYGVDHSWD